MGDYSAVSLKDKDTDIVVVPKQSPLLPRLLVLVFAVLCGILICFFCLQQFDSAATITTASFLNLNVQANDTLCPKPDLPLSQLPYVHFPKPLTYARFLLPQSLPPSFSPLLLSLDFFPLLLRAECSCTPVHYFAILSTQRSGSGWFETLLNSHLNVTSNGEVFSVKLRRANISTIFHTLDQLYNLDWFSSASKNECTAAVGLKWMLNQGLIQHHEEVVNYFTSKGVSVIFLFRRNLLRRMISILANKYDHDFKLLNGTHKSHVHSPHEVCKSFSLVHNVNFLRRNLLWMGYSVVSNPWYTFQAEILASYKPFVNATTLITELKHVQKTMAKALGYFNSTRHIMLYYEDLLKNRSKLLDVQDFLRIPRMNLTSRQVKIHKGSLFEQVANWNDVQRILSGTEYESFLSGD